MNKEQEEFNEINNIVSKTINILSDEDFCKLWAYILNKRHQLKEKNKEIERLNNIIDELILECYNCDITFGEFKNIWKKAYNKEYNSKDLDKLKELKGE